MPEAKKPWEQLSDEPDRSYEHFLRYLYLGPERSIDKAYALTRPVRTNAEGAILGNKTQRAPGNWTSESTQFNWPERAQAWDVVQFSTKGRNTVLAYVGYVHWLTCRALAKGEDSDIGPGSQDWESHLKTVEAIAKLIPAASVDALLRARSDGIAPVDESRERPA